MRLLVDKTSQRLAPVLTAFGDPRLRVCLRLSAGAAGQSASLQALQRVRVRADPAESLTAGLP